MFLLVSCGNRTDDESLVKDSFPGSIDSIFSSSPETLIDFAGEEYYYPRYSPDGSKIIVTGTNYK